jgi:hypothetical protein
VPDYSVCRIVQHVADPRAACTSLSSCLTMQEVRELIARCWSPNPEDRPAFATLVKELEAILTRLPRTMMLRQAADGGGCCALC